MTRGRDRLETQAGHHASSAMHEVLWPWRLQRPHALCEVHVRTVAGFVGRQETRESSRATGTIGNDQDERVVVP